MLKKEFVIENMFSLSIGKSFIDVLVNIGIKRFIDVHRYPEKMYEHFIFEHPVWVLNIS